MALPRACAGCGDTNTDQLEHYEDEVKESHNQYNGFAREAVTYSVRTDAYLCEDCKRTARSRLFRSWLRTLFVCLLILAGLIIYPPLIQNWWMFVPLIVIWVYYAAGYVVLLLVPLVFIYDGIRDIRYHPYRWFIRVRIDSSQFDGDFKLLLRGRSYAELVRGFNPRLRIEMKS